VRVSSTTVANHLPFNSAHHHYNRCRPLFTPEGQFDGTHTNNWQREWSGYTVVSAAAVALPGPQPSVKKPPLILTQHPPFTSSPQTANPGPKSPHPQKKQTL